jgi:hypothetical protein
MKVCLNDEIIDVDQGQSHTVASLLESLHQTDQIPPAHVVVDIAVDDPKWARRGLSDTFDDPLPPGCTVRIGTDDVRGHAGRILEDVQQMLNVAEQANREIARKMRGENSEEANSGLFRLLDTTQNLIGCLFRVQNSCQLSAGPQTGPGGVLESAGPCLEEIRQHQEDRDWTGLASILQNRFPDVLQDIRQLVRTMGEEL